MNVTILIPTAWLTSIGVPEHLQSDVKEVTDAAKSALQHALSRPLSEEVLNELSQVHSTISGPSVRVMMGLTSAASSALNSISAMHKLTAGPTAKRIIGLVASGKISVALAQSLERQVCSDHPLAKLNHLLDRKPRFAQAQFYDNLWATLVGGGVGLIEGGTGIGKTRAMMAAAVRWVHERRSSIGICAPTIALLRQMVSEHQRQHDFGTVPELCLIIGRREFVSEHALREFLNDRGMQWNSPAVQEWLNIGDVSDSSDHIDVSWQVHSLLQVAPDLPMDEVRLSDVCATDDRGYWAYRSQFRSKFDDANKVHNKANEEAQKPLIILFTHSMLAQDMRRKMISAGQDENYSAMQKFYIQALRNVKGKKRIGNESDFEAISILETELGVALNTAADGRAILPPFISLIIDEGHLLDESFSSSLSDYVSLTSVHSDLQSFHALGGKMMAGGLEIVANSIKALIAHAPTVDRRDFVALSGDGEGKLTPHLIAIATVCDSIDGVRAAGSDKYRLSLKIRRAGVIFSASVTRNRRTSFLRHSPIRQLPQLFVSNSNVQTILSRLWTSLESAALVSATLYMPTNDGPSSNFMSSLLQIPLDRLQTFPPVHEVWSTACVEGAWLPQSSTAWLCPPTISVAGSREKRTEQERQVAEVQWHADLASEIEKIWQFAAGGVLVLCTSYVTVQALHQMLCDKAHLANLLVAASPSHALRSQGRAFLGISHSGLKPLWLAVGSAWTGLDIGGHDPWTNLFGSELPAAEDNVLTDLVIPRVPYGTNQSLSHLWRIRNNPNVPWDLFDAALRFKQALGRLVRRDGLPNNRRIFVLDARMQDGMNGPRMTAFTQSLSKYKRKRLIKVT